MNADAKALGMREIGEEWIKAYREHGGTGNYTAHMHNLVLLTGGGVPIAPFKRILVRLKAPDASGALFSIAVYYYQLGYGFADAYLGARSNDGAPLFLPCA